MHAAGLNPTDFKHRALSIFLPPSPLTLGWDVSGTVAEIGFGITLFQPGDEVFGMLPYPHGAGSHAEYVTGPTRAFAAKPPGSTTSKRPLCRWPRSPPGRPSSTPRTSGPGSGY